jgi:hypothetical protein
MTFQVVVEARGQRALVKVDAANEKSAEEIAKWLVAHHAHLQAHGVVAKPKER